MSVVGASLLVLVCAAAPDRSAPKLPLGKETTYVTGPLDKNGYIDYKSALNERLGKGITPQKNANVLLWKVFGPCPEGARMPPDFFKLLGIAEPPQRGDYFIGLGTYLKEHAKLDNKEWAPIFEQLGWASARPWAAKDYPHIAGWLKANDNPLALAIAATKRPEYFNPMVSPKDKKGQGALIAVLLPSVQKCRELTSALVARAMLRTGNGDFDGAWQDLIACHRLARHIGRGPTLIEGLVGIAIEAIASSADLVWLDRAGLSADQARDCLRDLQALPPLQGMAEKVDLGERFMFLDTFQMLRRRGLGALEELSGPKAPVPDDPKAIEVLEKIDWAPPLRNANRWYDRMVAAMRLTERAQREKQLDKLDADLKELKAKVGGEEELARLIRGGAPDKDAGVTIGDMCICLLMPAVRKVQSAYDRIGQTQANLHLAFALAAYRSDHGRYPEKLEELPRST